MYVKYFCCCHILVHHDDDVSETCFGKTKQKKRNVTREQASKQTTRDNMPLYFNLLE